MNVQQFIDGFLGYGSLEAPIWFVGLEEWGGKSAEELLRRIEIWRQLGATPAVDLFEFHRDLNRDEFFGPKPKRQATWARISQMMLAAEGTQATSEAIPFLSIKTTWKKEGSDVSCRVVAPSEARAPRVALLRIGIGSTTFAAPRRLPKSV